MPDMTMTPEIKEMRQRVRAFMDENIYPSEEALSEHNGQSEALMKDLQAKAKAMGIWAPAPAGRGRRTGHRLHAVRLRQRDPGPQPVRSPGIRLAGPGLRKRRDPLAVRYGPAEGALAQATRGRRHPLLLLDDRARSLRRGPDRATDPRRPRRRRVGDQRPQVVHQRGDRRLIRHRHVRHRPGR